MYTRTAPSTTFRRVTLCLSSAAVLSLTGCGGASDSPSSNEAAAPTSQAQTSAAPEAVETSSATASPPGESAGAGTKPDWANPVTAPGTSIAKVAVGDMSVEVFQVGTIAATKTGSFVDPKTNKPLIEVGDKLLFVNYVVTNNGAPVDLGASLVSIDERYDDWPYLQGMDGLSDRTLFEAQGVNADAVARGQFKDPAIFTFGTGQSYSKGENFEYQPGSPITFKVSYTPVDATGKLQSDKRVEGTGSGITA